jgi:hypothetical protein
MSLHTDNNSQVAIRTRMKDAFARVLEKAKQRDHFLHRPRLNVAEPAPSGTAVDARELVSFAINTLGAASYRAGVLGTPVTVRVKDAATAEVLRAAIELSCRERPANRLIEVTVEGAGVKTPG